MKKEIRIAIAEDHTILRNTMVAMLEKEKGIKVVLEVENGKELIERLSSVSVDVLLLDLNMPIMNGKDVLEFIRRSFPMIKVLILSMHCSELHVERYIAKGAQGYLKKEIEYHELVDAIKNIAINNFYYNELVTKKLTDQILSNSSQEHQFVQNDPLTKREIQILKLICAQLSSSEIANELCISKRTVENHRTQLLRKTGVKNTVGLMEYAIQNGNYEVGPLTA